MKDPLITICLLTHNSERFLEKSLKSILLQDYPNFEIIISDNQSDDKTEEIIKSFKNPKINLRKNIPDIKPGTFYDGCYDNCNGCLKSGLIKGEFVSFCHSDDVYDKDIFKKQADFLMENPGAGAVFTLGNIIDENDRITRRYKMPKELKGKKAYEFKDIFNAVLKYGNTFLITPTFMARREVFEKIGIFYTDGLFGTSADLEMWLRIAKKYPIGILENRLINRRSGGAGKKHLHLYTERPGFFKVVDYFLSKDNLSNKIEKKYLRQYEYQKHFDDTLRAMNFLIKGDEESAKKLLNRLFSFNILKAFFENINMRRIKVFVLRIALFFGINLGFGKTLSKILKKYA